MNDSKITKKHHPSGSLTRRILIVAIVLLVVPLFFQSFFLYRQEYRQKLADIEVDLKILAEERAYFLKEMILLYWKILEQNELNGNVKQLYIESIELPPGAGKRFIAISGSRQALLVCLALSEKSASAMKIPLKGLAASMPRAYPVRLSLLTSKGQLLWESSKLEKGEQIEEEVPVGKTSLRLQLSIEKKQIRQLRLQSYYFRFAALVFLVGCLGGYLVFWLTRRMAKPLRSLCKTMERVAQGAAHVRYKPDRMGFEINALGMQFNETLDGLLRHAEEAEKQRIEREKLAKEFSIGHEIQANLLPKQISGLSGLDIASIYLASKEVNGDFYDLFKLADGKLLIAICDTAGKGISACLFALGLRSMIRALANVETDLATLILKVNDLYSIDAHPTSMFSTLWIGIYDPEKKELTYCSQGHPPALLIRGGQLEELWTAGIALGAQKMDLIPTKRVHLEKNDLLILYTDGIIEAHNSSQQLFGKDRFYELFMHKQKTSAQQITDRVIEEVQLFAKGIAQHDDITLLIIRIEK